MTIAETAGTERPRSIFRSIGAVLAGLIAIFVLSTATDAVLHATGVYPPPLEPMSGALFLLATVYRIIYGVAGGFLAAWLAPGRPMAHALVLGGIGFVIATVGAVAMWDHGPAWFHLAVIAIAIPCAWGGGRLFLAWRGSV